MKIAVFLSSRMGSSPVLKETAEKTGAWLAGAGHELIYGGEDYGLMSVLAGSVIAHGGRVTGVIPNIPLMMENVHPRLSSYVYVRDMAERKDAMLRLADGFLALPGGFGTLDEFSELLCANRVFPEQARPLALLSVNGFYKPFEGLLANMLAESLIDAEDLNWIRVADDLEVAAAFLEGFAEEK